MRRSAAVVCAAVLASMGPALTPSGAAYADSGVIGTPVALPITTVVDLVVDPVHQHVFVSDGTNTVVVTDLDGQVVQTLSNLPGAEDMTLSPDGAQLYVALTDGDGIVVMDTSDLSYRKLSTGAGSCPSNVAVTLGLVWYGYGCSFGSGDLGALDPRTGRRTEDIGGPRFFNAPDLVSDPLGHPGLLVASTPGLSAKDLDLMQVAGGRTPTITSELTRHLDSGAGVGAGAAVVGETLLAVGTSSARLFDLADLSGSGVLPTGNYAQAVAARDDGVVAVGTTYQDDDVYLFSPEHATPEKLDITTGPSEETKRVAFGDRRLFVVTGDNDGNDVSLHVIEPPAPVALTISTDQPSYPQGGVAAIVAHLGSGVTGSLTLFATVDGVRRQVTSAAVDPDGDLHATVPVRERTVLSAYFAGDDDYSPRVVSTTVTAPVRMHSAMADHYARSGHYGLYRVGQHAAMATAIAPLHDGDCVPVRVQSLSRSREWRTLSTRCVGIAASGSALRVVRGHNAPGTHLRLRAEWPGDDRNTAVTGGWHYARFTR